MAGASVAMAAEYRLFTIYAYEILLIEGRERRK